jgi:hypothetical protein
LYLKFTVEHEVDKLSKRYGVLRSRMEDSYECIEYALADSHKLVVLELGVWAEG